ncbi:MAG: hypothetical protein ACR2NN_01790 [Bryobacteraceae bacterium]
MGQTKQRRLLAEAERAGFDALLTAGKNMRYQQNLTGRGIGIVGLSTPQWPVVRLHLDEIAAALDGITPGRYAEVDLSVKPTSVAKGSSS